MALSLVQWWPLQWSYRRTAHIVGLQDSKRLTARQRDAVYERIQQQALAYGIGIVSHTQIDQRNILWATQQAMLGAVQQLHAVPDILLIDGITALPTDDCTTSYYRWGRVLCFDCRSVSAGESDARPTDDGVCPRISCLRL